MSDRSEREGWDARPWTMAALGAVAGILIHLLTDGMTPANADSLRIAATAFIAASATLFAFTFEPVRGRWAAIFALGAGAVVGLVIYWNGSPDSWDASETWRSVCVALAVAIAAPLFQTARDEGRAHFPYVAVHGHSWINVVIWCAAWAFVGVVFVLTFLLSALFELIGIDLFRDLLREGLFNWTLGGAAFGAAVGLFRERDRIVGLLQRVVVSVLAVLAPALGAGLILFMLSLPFTGLAPLWEATKSTTPILLSCIIGALILANAVIGNSEAEESRFAPLRFGAMALGLAMLPFALIAAVSTGARIDQYGFTPDRLWALVFVIVATAYGLAYLVALVRKRLDWAEAVRPANLILAFGLCALALFLATPILSFNAISTRDQVARLESGRVSAEKFDWGALRFDFGGPGREAVDHLAKSGSTDVKKRALAAQKLENRWDADSLMRPGLAQRLRVVPAGAELPPRLFEGIDGRLCDTDVLCVVVVGQRPDEAFVVDPQRYNVMPSVTKMIRKADGSWIPDDELARRKGEAENALAGVGSPELKETAKNSRERVLLNLKGQPIELRRVERRQIFVAGVPVDEAFE